MRAAQRLGATSVWPLYYAGTMGLVQRDGMSACATSCAIRASTRPSARHSSIAGWMAGVGAKMGPDPREMGDVGPDHRVGQQSGVDPGQRHDAYCKSATRAQRAILLSSTPIARRQRKSPIPHLMLKPGTDGALACAIMHVHVPATAMRTAEYMRTQHRLSPANSRLISRRARRSGPPPSPVCRSQRSNASPSCMALRSVRSSASAMASRASATARRACTRCPALPRSAANGRTAGAARSTATATSTRSKTR